MFYLENAKQKPYLKMRPAGDQTNRAQSQREKKPHDPTTSSVYPTTPMMINIPIINLIADGRCFGADWLKTQNRDS